MGKKNISATNVKIVGLGVGAQVPITHVSTEACMYALIETCVFCFRIY